MTVTTLTNKDVNVISRQNNNLISGRRSLFCILALQVLLWMPMLATHAGSRPVKGSTSNIYSRRSLRSVPGRRMIYGKGKTAKGGGTYGEVGLGQPEDVNGGYSDMDSSNSSSNNGIGETAGDLGTDEQGDNNEGWDQLGENENTDFLQDGTQDGQDSSGGMDGDAVVDPQDQSNSENDPGDGSENNAVGDSGGDGQGANNASGTSAGSSQNDGTNAGGGHASDNVGETGTGSDSGGHGQNDENFGENNVVAASAGKCEL